MENKRHILLIEDSPTQARYTGLLLEDAGYQVSIVSTGNAGVDMAETSSPDLILLDVVLPDLDGFSVCRLLRQKMTQLYIPILMFTEQRIAVEDKIDGLSVGADDYLTKPVDERELVARIAALLRIKQVIDELHLRLTNEHQSYQALKRIALTDHLTGLYNRHYFTEALTREFGLAHRYGTPLACIMSDIDHFRDFNTLHGHATGDWVLQGVARLMQSSLRQGDIIARYGGEEFVLLLPMTEATAAAILAERLRALVSNKSWNHPSLEPLCVTVSLGIAGLPSPMIHTPDQLLACADKALYKAKLNGRNQVAI